MPDVPRPNDSPLRQRERLDEIARLGLLDPSTGPLLEDVAARAATQVGLPISLVSVVMDDAQHFASSHGVGGWLAQTQGTPVEWSFCAVAVESGEPFVVEDAEVHPDVRDNPLVPNDGIRCYAGVPLVSQRGFRLGTLCVIGAERRSFTEDDLDALRELADEAVERLEANALGGYDSSSSA